MKNNCTFLEKLLDGSEVEWKPLDEVANIVNNARKPVKSSSRVSGNIPYYGANNIQDYVEGYTHEGEFVLIAEDGSASLENYSIQWAVGKFWANNHVHVVNGKEKLNNRFLYHYLTNMNFIPFLAGKERAKLTKAKLQQIPIPIPPLSVQTEIVKILDALTALTSELTSELILRQKQYEYYREKLLSEEELEKVGGEWKNLKDILINLRTGLNPRNNFKLNTDGAENYYITVRELDSVNIKITDKTDKISNQAREIIDKRSKLNIGDILFSGTGTIGKTAFISELPRNWNIKEGVYALTVNQEIIKPMYLLRLLQSEITKKQINNFVMGSTVKSISMADLKKVKILIPSLDEQQCIVSILDKFETLTNSITEGLPLAIEQSQKRYEYYRELLLNFPGRE